MALKQITRVNIAEKVFEQLRDQILQGTWKEGEKLPSEQELTETLGVSRSSVRQAIRTLADYGMVETRNGTGTYVKRQISGNYMLNIVPIGDLQFEDIVEVLDFLCLIEDSVAAMAVQRCTQEELAEKLNEAGFNVTQATVSRDIRELKLTKIQADGGRQRYVVLEGPKGTSAAKFIRVLQDGFMSMDMAQNILVIKTVSGMAMAVAAALDAIHFHEIVGCIAGDDTIMCAIRSVDDTIIVMEKIKKMVEA